MSSGNRSGQRGNAARQQYLANQLQTAQALGIPVSTAQGNLNDALNQATLGVPVERQNAVGEDLRGKYMGYGTAANAGRNLFSTKESVLMVPEWSDALNAQLQRQRPLLQQALQQGATDFSLGIEGILPEGGAGPYVRGINQYYPDDRARMAISGLRGPNDQLNTNIPTFVLPGSTQQRALNAQGYSIGLVFVKNPQNKTGYLRVGSKGWRDALARWANGEYAGSPFDFEHLFGQGAVYGLGPAYHPYNIQVIPRVKNQRTPVRFSVPNVVSYIKNGSSMRSIQTIYDAYLKNPDQQRIGRYGAAALLLRHADKMNTTGTGDAADMNAVNQAVLNAWQQNGSVAGVAHWGTANGTDYSDFSSRLGLTANPLRNARGQAVDRLQSVDPSSGECNIYGSGPGVEQRASFGGEYGFRFTKQSRKHQSKRKGAQGIKENPTTYFCGPTQDYVVNPDRKLYQAGGIRATPDASLEQVLATYGNPAFTGDNLRDRYLDWARNPAAYGTNPYFMLNPDDLQFGFAKYAPTMYAANMTPEQAMAFNNLNLTNTAKVQRSSNLAAQAQGRQVQNMYPKTSPPTGGFQVNPQSLPRGRAQ